jgi:L-lactate dehydrogenase complex protein LldG
MSAARDEILSRIRGALVDVPATETPDDVVVTRDYRSVDGRPRDELIALLGQRLGDYNAEVRRVAVTGVADAVRAACADAGIAQLAVAPGVPAEWRPEGIEIVEDHDLGAAELDELNAALTG